MAGRYSDRGWRDPAEAERVVGYGARPRTAEDRRCKPGNLLHRYALNERSQRLQPIHRYCQLLDERIVFQQKQLAQLQEIHRIPPSKRLKWQQAPKNAAFVRQSLAGNVHKSHKRQRESEVHRTLLHLLPAELPLPRSPASMGARKLTRMHPHL